MAFPDHRGQELEKHVDELMEKLDTMRDEKETLHQQVFDLTESVNKLEKQLEWIDLHILTAEEGVEMEAYCDI